MSEFFEYLGEVLKRVFQDIGAFFNTAFASPWGPVGENFKAYGELFNQYSRTWGAGGWIFYVIFIILLILLIGGLGILLFFLLRKYIRFVKREINKEELQETIERLNYELFNTKKKKIKSLH